MNAYLLMENFDHILLFKTDCKTAADKIALQGLLGQLDGIDEWNIDMDDQDKVLRIISYTLNHQCIINLINQHGYNCCELF